MKKVMLLMLLSIALSTLGQDTTTLFFDKNWKKVKSKDDSEYYRKMWKADQTWQVIDFYYDGKIQMTGAYKSKRCKVDHGYFKWYNKFGLVTNEGMYENGKKEGKWIRYNSDGFIIVDQSFENGKENGDWTWYSDSGKVCAKEKYLDGKRTEASFWNEEGVMIDSTVAEYQARWPYGGNDHFVEWLYNETKYPLIDRQNGKQGIVIASFVVDTNGDIIRVNIIKGISNTIDKEVIRVLSSSPKWIPGKFHNRPARTEFKIPIKFTLQG